MATPSEPSNLDSLAAELTGPLLVASSPGYDAEVTAFNLAIRHTPAIVVGASTAADVQAAVRYAASQHLAVGVQATGHGAGAMRIDGGVLITTKRLDALSVDVSERTVTVGAGTPWRKVIAAVAPHGLAPLSGSSSDVSAVGYTLGGGLPVMGRTFGFAADRVRGFEVVTADGVLRHVDAANEPDLFWGLCGGKGNLGIVTAMCIELVDVTTVYGGGIFYAASDIADVLRAYPAWAEHLPESTSTSIAILRLPPAPEVPAPIRGQTLAHLRICHVGDPAEGARLVAPMREVAPALLEHLGEMPYSAIDSIHQDPDHPVPFRERGALLGELTVDTVDALLAVAGPDQHVPLIVCEIRQMGGALRHGPVGGNAVGGREGAYSVLAIGLLTAETAAVAPAAVDAVVEAIEPWATGGTLANLHGHLGDEVDRARAWEPAILERLVDLSRTVDPSGLLRYGHVVGRAPIELT